MKNLIIILIVLVCNGTFAQNIKEDEGAKLVSEEKKSDIETGKKIADYDLFPAVIKTNMSLEEITANQKWSLKEQKKEKFANGYKYLRYNFFISPMNPKEGKPEVSEVLFDSKNKLAGYAFLYIDGNKKERKKSECDAVYNDIKNKLEKEIDLKGKESFQKQKYQDDSTVYINFLFYTSNDSNNTLLVAYRFREFAFDSTNNTAIIEVFKLPVSFDKINQKTLRLVSDESNGYNNIYNMLRDVNLY